MPTDFPVNNMHLSIYLVFTLLSIIVSAVAYIYIMNISKIHHLNRTKFTSHMFAFIKKS